LLIAPRGELHLSEWDEHDPKGSMGQRPLVGLEVAIHITLRGDEEVLNAIRAPGNTSG